MKYYPMESEFVIDTRDNTLWRYCCRWPTSDHVHIFKPGTDPSNSEGHLLDEEIFHKHFQKTKERV